jgi:3-hydroxybutyryl-CoA dehydrogenase
MLTSRSAGRSGHGFATAAVVGAGLMGRGIAGVLAGGGLDVVLCDIQPEVLAQAVASAAEAAGTAGTGRAAEAAGTGTGGGRVSGCTELSVAVRDADLVVEAVVESLPVKQDVIARIAAAARGAVIATNTSVLPVTAIAERALDPRRVLGTHWWNPPDLIPVVEVVQGQLTAQDVIERVMALLGDLGKTPVRVRRDVPGFIGNRLQHALWREAIALVADGICDADTADLVARNTIGLRLARMGPLENADYVGLDLTLAIHDAVFPSLSTDAVASPSLRALVRRGDLGAKTGRGFLPWPAGSRETAARELAAHVRAQEPSGTARCSGTAPGNQSTSSP